MDFDKYEKEVYKNLDKNNMDRIITFLKSNKCDYIEDLVEDYLDIFTFDYDNFIRIFNILNKKYNNNLINEISNDMNILEEFYNI